MDAAPKLLTRADLAARLGVSVRTITRYRKLGRLPPPIRGIGVLRWHPDDFERWLRRR
jgi:predicted site-specific integrase-resolvase